MGQGDRVLYVDDDTGASFVRIDPQNAQVLYAGLWNVRTGPWEDQDKSHLSTGQVQDVTPIPVRGADTRFDRTEPLWFAPRDPRRMYYAANRVYESLDRGQNWRVISPDLTRENPGVPPSVGALHSPKVEKQRGAIYAASASPLADGMLWAGTDDGLVWVTLDDGQHWQNDSRRAARGCGRERRARRHRATRSVVRSDRKSRVDLRGRR